MGRVAFLLAVVLLFGLASPAYAADGEDGGGFWDVVDAIWGVLSGIVDAVGGFIRDVVGAIWNAFKWLLDGLKALFIPREDYFPKAFARFRDKLSEKFGGILGMGTYLKNRFSELRAYRGIDGSFVIQFPKGHLLNGISVDLLSGGAGVISMIRGAFSGLVAIMTFAFCYKRLIGFINT